MWDKARHGNEEQVREAFEDFRGQDPRGRPLLRRRPDGPSGSGPERPEPQHRQPPLPRALRERILLACEVQRPLFGTVEIDESFFGARRVKGRRGRGACGKTIVFGIFERQGQVYTEIVPDCSKPTLQSIIRGWVDPRTVINSDGWPGSTAWSTSAMATSGSIIPGMRGAPSTSTTSRASGAWPRSA